MRPQLPTMLAPPYSFHGPVSPADARIRRNHRRPSHTLTVDPTTGVETLYVRFAITASDPLASSSSDSAPGEGGNLIARSWDWAKTWIGPLVWDDSHHPGAYDPKLSNGLTASERELQLERERKHREQLERSERERASWTGWVANGLSNFVGSVVGSSLGGLRNLSGAKTAAAPGSGGEGYFRRPRKPAYGEYTSAEVVAELQKVRCTSIRGLVSRHMGKSADSFAGERDHRTGSQHGSLCLQATLRRHSRYIRSPSFRSLSLGRLVFPPFHVSPPHRKHDSLKADHQFSLTWSDTRASNYYRHDIPTATIVPPPDQEGQQQQPPNRWRFWNRQKTVVA